jgi:hypothetical protein
MIAFVALFAVAQIGGVENQIYNDLSKKLSVVAFQTTVNLKGELKRCTVTHSSGDPEVDRIFCDSLHVCLPEGTAETAATMGALTLCTNESQKKMLRELAAKRAGGSSAGK